MENDVESGDDLEYESEDDDTEFGEGNGTNYAQSGASSERSGESENDQDTLNQTCLPARGPLTIPNFFELIGEFSKLIVQPIEEDLENLVTENDTKPQLLIIPQGETFNIPYSTLRLRNGKPLCSLVAPREAFSFHSYSYSATLQEGMSQVRELIIFNV